MSTNIIETKVTENTTVVIAKRIAGGGWDSFTMYSDADTKPFVSGHITHETKKEAVARAARLVAFYRRG
jgi:hypothetical protein